MGGLLFLGYYMIYLLGLEWTAPGYIARVWNLSALSGLSLFGMPVEELSAYWSGVYEHFTWKTVVGATVRQER